MFSDARLSHSTHTGTRTARDRHEVYDSKADVWSWGVLLSECITCAMPYGHTFMTPVQVRCARMTVR